MKTFEYVSFDDSSDGYFIESMVETTGIFPVTEFYFPDLPLKWLAKCLNSCLKFSAGSYLHVAFTLQPSDGSSDAKQHRLIDEVWTACVGVCHGCSSLKNKLLCFLVGKVSDSSQQTGRQAKIWFNEINKVCLCRAVRKVTAFLTECLDEWPFNFPFLSILRASFSAAALGESLAG